MIKFSNVSKMYGDNIGVSDINITIEDGEFVFLVGPSGAGKSTFIKLLLKEKEADEGTITFDDFEITSLSNRMVPYYRRKVGIVFQDFRLLSTKTVYENVAFAMEAVHQKKKLIKAQVPHILNLVGISDKAHLYPSQLSGGEAQRVAIARAIVNNPKVLIADEPTGNLDPEKSWEIMNLLEQINKRGTTVVMVTHAKDIVDRMGKRVVQLVDGRIVRDDKTGLYVERQVEPEIEVTEIFESDAVENEIPETPEFKVDDLAGRLKKRESKYQETLRKFNEKHTSDDTKKLKIEDLFENAGELEDQVSEEGGDF
ncbi:MAG: cell division ATP-binding protein FtsE [Firmicutes bacterium]|nr:cell division ATP-binding protein FtsE [Bacillota bacterium]